MLERITCLLKHIGLGVILVESSDQAWLRAQKLDILKVAVGERTLGLFGNSFGHSVEGSMSDEVDRLPDQIHFHYLLGFWGHFLPKAFVV